MPISTFLNNKNATDAYDQFDSNNVAEGNYISSHGVSPELAKASGIKTPADYSGTTRMNFDSSTPEGSKDTGTKAPPTGDNSAAGWVGAIFNMVNEVIGGTSTIMQLAGIDPTANTQKKQYQQSFDESKRRFDKTFFENVRQFNLEYALKEWSTRKGLKLQEAQQRWNEFIAGSNIKAQEVQTKQAQFNLDKDVAAYKNKLKFANTFAVGYANAMRGK